MSAPVLIVIGGKRQLGQWVLCHRLEEKKKSLARIKGKSLRAWLDIGRGSKSDLRRARLPCYYSTNSWGLRHALKLISLDNRAEKPQKIYRSSPALNSGCKAEDGWLKVDTKLISYWHPPNTTSNSLTRVTGRSITNTFYSNWDCTYSGIFKV